MSKPSRNTGKNQPRTKRPAKPSDAEPKQRTGRSIYKGDVADRGLEDPRHWLDVSADKPEHFLEVNRLEGPTEASEPSTPRQG